LKDDSFLNLRLYQRRVSLIVGVSKVFAKIVVMERFEFELSGRKFLVLLNMLVIAKFK